VGCHATSHSFGREEKEEKKRLEKHGKTSTKAGRELDDIFAIEYTKRGSTREWDEGQL
jgi:hypothetical protein